MRWRHVRQIATVACVVAAVGFYGCEASKSRNPLSPSVAGPIPGVNITAPKLLEPANGHRISTTQQPVTLLIENAGTNGERPLTYLFEIAADVEFTNRVFAREGVSPGQGGRTSLRLPEPLEADRTYYWRARAQDGANTGPYSAASNFTVYTPVVIEAPVPVSPVGGVTVSSRRPTFVTQNAERSGPAGPVSYIFEISLNDSFTAVAAIATITEQPGQTSFTLAQDLEYSKTYFWHVRAFETTVAGPWSPTQVFVTPAAPPVTPPPSPPPTPPAGGYPNNGPDIIAYVAQRYPQYLAAGVSYDQRISNMEFLRDRVIEVGICGGLDLAWNLKRGVGPRSIDAIAWRTGGKVEVVDIGAAYDDTSQPLRLQWVIVEGPPGYDPYPTPSCK